MPWDILLILIGWFIGVFGVYLMYEFTAEYLNSSSPLIRFARFYLPGLFPVAVTCALVLARLNWKIFVPVLAAVVIAGGIIYLQYMLNENATRPARSAPDNKNVPGLQQPGKKPPGRTPTLSNPSLRSP